MLGFLSVRAIGNQKHYQANRHFACLLSSLHGLVIKTFGVADVLRQVLLPFAAEN
jgi:hypothetical protein